MNKKMLIVLVLSLLVAGGAFADFALGLQGALYIGTAELQQETFGSVASAFAHGDGIYYGPMIEFLSKYWGVGGSFMFSRYLSSFNAALWDWDANVYLGVHFLGSRFVFDPSIEAGLGYIQKDYFYRWQDDDPNNPLAATWYWYLGGGLELNVWRLGIYSKFIYHFPLGPAWGGGDLMGIPLEPFALKPYKIILGVKFMFGQSHV